MGRLRIEEPVAAITESVQATVVPLVPVQRGLEEWRKLAVQSGERLQYAENQLKDLRAQADDLRARLTKSKTRLDSANERTNELQSQLIAVTAERDELRDRVARQDIVKRKVHEYRQSILDGPLWELFAEL